jgi:hypothetical protein
MFAAAPALADTAETTWVVESGATSHYLSVLSDFTNLMTSTMGIVIGIDCEVEGLGDVIINVSNAEVNCVSITLKDVLFVPSLEDRSK